MSNLFKHSRNIFLIDALGALLTAFLSGIVLRYFQTSLGMPAGVLIFLSLLACLFAVFSFTCYFSGFKKWQLLLTVIAVSNLLYALLILGLVLYLYPILTPLAVLYFSGEILVLLILVAVEFRIISLNRGSKK